MDGLLLAFGFLTVIPMPFLGTRPGGMGRAAAWFPVVGLVVGAAMAGVGWGSRWLWHDPLVAAALVLGANLLLTGGLHLDGFMDTADAFFSHRSPERMLEIMKDSRSGALGVASGVVLLLIKFAATGALLRHSGLQPLLLLALAPVLGRASMVYAARFPCARTSGLGASFAREVRAWHCDLALLSALAIAAFAGPHGLLIYGLMVVLAVVDSLYWRRRLGGLTGDIYGAINEGVEAGVLLLAAYLVR